MVALVHIFEIKLIDGKGDKSIKSNHNDPKLEAILGPVEAWTYRNNLKQLLE